MATLQTWDKFPLNYRAEAASQLAHWIAAGKSCAVVGLPGCGRSNLLNFLCHRPEALAPYLPPNTRLALVSVDLNDLPANDLSSLYRVILRSFYHFRQPFKGELAETTTRLYLENRATTDPFLSQSALQELLQAFQKENTQVVLVLNRFDRFCQEATPRMLNTLRSLRDSSRETLTFIVGMRQEVAYLPQPKLLGDMYPLLDRKVYWVGAMNEEDAQALLRRETSTAPTPLTDAEIQTILNLTGGFPVLLSVTAQWWCDQRDKPPLTDWSARLTAEPGFEFRLAQLWENLTREEQFALAAISSPSVPPRAQANHPPRQNHESILIRLVAKGVCRQLETGWEINGGLLADYIKRVGSAGQGRIYVTEHGEIYQGSNPVKLFPLGDKLLRFLLQHPYVRHTHEELIKEVWGEVKEDDNPNKAPTRTDLHRVVADLRRKIEANTAEPRYLINWRGRSPLGGYQFYPEGRPVTDESS